jgi:HD-like signal output (HDOD) protein
MERFSGQCVRPSLSGADAEALHAHCRRVAAWATELARDENQAQHLSLLEHAALLHHYPVLLLQEDSAARLITELRLAESNSAFAVDSDVREVLQCFHGCANRVSDQHIAGLAALLELADNFDNSFEASAWIGPEAEADAATQAVLGRLQTATNQDLLDAGKRLPVFPVAAQKAMRLLSNPNASLFDLEMIAASDQALAAHVIRAANSPNYAHRREFSRLRDAVTFIGFDEARRLISAASLRPLFGQEQMRALWNHSLEASELACRLASRVPTVDPNEAFVAGLVHDLGQLVFALLPPRFQERRHRLIQQGCDPYPVEVALCGHSHAHAGALVLAAWNFPKHLAEAIAYHHEPERTASRLAAILYLTEYWSGANEDLPSAVRLRSACATTSIDAPALHETARQSASGLEALKYSLV